MWGGGRFGPTTGVDSDGGGGSAIVCKQRRPSLIFWRPFPLSCLPLDRRNESLIRSDGKSMEGVPGCVWGLIR